jgi:outer membrane protein assembly factor BamB
VTLGDYSGDLVAVDLATGAVTWRAAGNHVGPVAVIDGRATFAVADNSGAVVAFDDAGTRVERWEVPAVTGMATMLNQIAVGPVAGHGALWLVDENGRVLRLGPGGAGAGAEAPDELGLSWMELTLEAPFDSELARSTPVTADGDAYLFSGGGWVLRFDPATGDFERTGELEDEEVLVVLPAPVADGVAYVAAQQSVVAAELPSGTTRWDAPLPGYALQPPVLAGDALVVPSTAEDQHHVSVFDRDSGRLRWTAEVGAPLSDASAAGAVVADGLVIAGDPVEARAISDGEVAWTSDAAGTVGPVALAGDDDVVLAATATLDGADERGFLVALDAATGQRRWRVRTDGVIPDALSDLLVAAGPEVGPEDAVAIVTTFDRRTILGVGVATGEELWRRELPAARLGQGALLDGNAWFALVDGRVLAIDPTSGATLARSPELGIDLEDAALAQRPVLVDGTVVVTAGYTVFGLAVGSGG